MKSFLARHASKIKGVLSGFDRIRFRGTLRWLANVRGMKNWLWHRQVLFKNFKDYALSLTDQLREETKRIADAAQCPMLYLERSWESKEDQARRIATANNVHEGLVCVLTAVEPCQTFNVGPNPRTKEIEVRSFRGKCLHQYFYYIHPEWGWMHARLQTWLPFTIHVVINGRDWLAGQLQRAGIGHQQRDNCFVDVDDTEKAQAFLSAQLRTAWKPALERLRRQFHPGHERIFGADRPHYYWSADETEWATDILFRSPQELAEIYLPLVRHGITSFGSGDVLRFLGKRPRVLTFTGTAIHSEVKKRPEGIRIKHQAGHNAIKMYDKQESVLRIETTINDVQGMREFRKAEGDPETRKQWRKLRKGVAGLRRRAAISEGANQRYLEALSTVQHPQPLQVVAGSLSRPTKFKGRRVRALNPLGPDDGRLLQAISRGEFLVGGFRNRDLRPFIFDQAASPTTFEGHRQSAKVSRLLRLLRGHKLISKIPKSHRYRLTKHGRIQVTALIAAQNANTKKLTELAA